jgi:chemotaxis protein MotB
MKERGMMARWRSAALLTVLAGFAAVGCDNQRDAQIAELQRQNEELQASNSDLQNRLAQCQRDADACQRRAMQLQGLLDDANRRLASGAMPTPIEPSPRSNDGWTEMPGLAWIDLGADVLFDSGKATLKGSAKDAIRSVASKIQSSYAGREIWVIGHTDAEPIKKTKDVWTDNLDLSQGRAATVARELYALGISPPSIIAGGQGEYNPREANDRNGRNAKNRRVQVVAVEKPLLEGTSQGG